MKRFLIFFLLAAVMMAATEISFGQMVTRKAKDSVVNADTAYAQWNSTGDGIKGFQLTALKVSGTVSAYAVIETRIDTLPRTLWIRAPGTDTFTLANSAPYQLHVWGIDNQFGNGYRIKVVSTGTMKAYLWGSFLKRTR